MFRIALRGPNVLQNLLGEQTLSASFIPIYVRMVGAGKEERALSSPWLAVRKRLPWLNINLVTAFIAAAVVGLFENTIAQFTALAVLLPVVAGQSGNTGAQALAVVMRGLALREIRPRHAPRVLFKEGLAGTLNGIAIALVTGAGVWVWSGSLGLSAVIAVEALEPDREILEPVAVDIADAGHGRPVEV